MKLSHKKPLWLSWPRVAVIGHDLLMVVLVWLGLQWLRYEMQPAAVMPATDWIELLLVVALQGIAFRLSGLYHGLWRFASTPDLFNLLKASVLGVVAIVGALFLYKRLEGVPRSVLLMYPFALVMLLGMPRWLYRIWKDGIL